MSLVRASLAQFEELLSSASDVQDAELLSSVVDLFLVTTDEQNVPAADAFGEVMEFIAYGLPEVERAELAERISKASPAPRDLIVRLANDAIAVARPVLTHSPCLSDEDLVSVMRAQGFDHIAAITGRAQLSEAVTDAIVETGDEQLITKAARHKRSRFSSKAFKKIAEIAKRVRDLVVALLQRSDVPAGIEAQVRRTAAEKGWADKTEKPVPAESKAQKSKPGVKKKAPPVTEAMLARYADDKDEDAVIRCLSEMTGFSQALIRQVMFATDLSALIVVCRAHRFGTATFAALFHLRQKEEQPDPMAFTNAMRRYDAMEPRNAELLMRMLKDKQAAKSKSQSTDDETPIEKSAP